MVVCRLKSHFQLLYRDKKKLTYLARVCRQGMSTSMSTGYVDKGPNPSKSASPASNADEGMSIVCRKYVDSHTLSTHRKHNSKQCANKVLTRGSFTLMQGSQQGVISITIGRYVDKGVLTLSVERYLLHQSCLWTCGYIYIYK